MIKKVSGIRNCKMAAFSKLLGIRLCSIEVSQRGDKFTSFGPDRNSSYYEYSKRKNENKIKLFLDF